jgi:hypothetical protein
MPLDLYPNKQQPFSRFVAHPAPFASPLPHRLEHGGPEASPGKHPGANTNEDNWILAATMESFHIFCM